MALATRADGKTDWAYVVQVGRRVCGQYDVPLTLRQLFYLLFQREGVISNDKYQYQRLSAVTADLRRRGLFPELADNTRHLVNANGHQDELDPPDANDRMRQFLEAVPQWYRPAAERQPVILHLACEKDTLVGQLERWFANYELPTFACRGYGSETQERQINRALLRARRAADREAVCLYAGDFDPSGEDIERNLRENCDYDEVIRVAVLDDHIDTYNLTENPGKTTDSRARQFYERHGRLVQVEVEALDPNDLRQLVQNGIDEYWDYDIAGEVEQQAAEERGELQLVVNRVLHLVDDHDLETICEHDV